MFLCCQAGIGLLLWIIAGDLVRYRPLVVATGGIYLFGAPVFWLIHASAGTPRWWAVMDVLSCSLAGAGLLALCVLSSPAVRWGARDAGTARPGRDARA